MNRKSSVVVLASVVAGLVLTGVGAWQFGLLSTGRLWAQAPGGEHSRQDEEDHEGHDAPSHGQAEPHDHDDDDHDAPDGAAEHAGHEEGEGAEDHGHEEEPQDAHQHGDAAHEEDLGAVKLTPSQMRKAGVALAVAGPGTIDRKVRLPGEIVINADTAAHIVPPAGGVVREVMVKVGDRVEAGDVMAALESAVLGEAKTQYLAQWNELSCCGIDLARAEALHGSTRKLLDALAKSPTLDELRELTFTDVGQGHSKLIAAYAEVVFAEAEYDREKKLVEQNISRKADLLTAENAYKKAFAALVATRGELAFGTRRALLEAQRSRQNTELQLRAADRKLHLLGLSAADVASLRRALSGDGSCGADCSDPNCATCKAGRATTGKAHNHALEEQLGLYSVRAPFRGTVIEKHITLGEKLADDADVFTIADMSTVWVDLSVYQKDLPSVRRGQAARIIVGSGAPEARGKIAFVSPIVDENTRTCTARVVLPNPDGSLRPGLFITAELDAGQTRAAVLVPKEAVQRIGEERVVFVPTAAGFVPKPVALGRQSRTHAEVISGLSAGERYVARGAFELKAKLVTSGLGAHAGHGH